MDDSALPLKGRNIVVTGAASSIGEATAMHLASLGANLALTDVAGCNKLGAQLEALVKEGRAPRINHVGASMNATNYDGVHKLLKGFSQTFKGLHGLVHCTDVSLPPNDFIEETLDAIQTTVQVNISGTINFTQAFLKQVLDLQMRPPTGGFSIVLLGPPVNPSGHNALSFTSRSAIHGLTRALAKEHSAVPIRCNCIGLGKEPASFMSNEQNPGNFAKLAGFLLGPSAAYISGACIPVDSDTVSYK